MNARHLLLAMLMAVIVTTSSAAKGAKDISIQYSARVETHSFEGTKIADNALLNVFSAAKNTGQKSTVAASIGHRYDLDDTESENLGLSLAYIHNFSRSSYAVAGYSNFKSYESIDDGRIDGSDDMLNFTHGWKVIKQNKIHGSFLTSLSTDTAFDDNRYFSETARFGGPVGKKYNWNFSYQLGYSLVDHRHTVDAYDFRVATPLSRNALIALGHRRVNYIGATGNDTADNGWNLTYSLRIR